ncbi:Glycosyltransferase, catalytic subunit of cellulose synthase and poly-beta-1,6-N-acetylglucosamine synthase [Jatrophihabitans endophyticus]|uniref:Glycosyltransferase, catalytic subunit of cellulose synthase and poly-beta-1,6-N-acetylglucosamine synthase n=1 Tax=Jatrophihabitans endophyticus TaxID=1206085 RepID=A0A1M5CHV7_9ACTN|nr:glycosyltransferase family 2 protein [Jatrophihabitans endophyticus]SHF54260.1 Glycosyltransferase, catalytic subunit of cellulose synthase and poly-beta-1,6-N-acetylglucosamine synthase [Jatrophihabitans endophyticus]
MSEWLTGAGLWVLVGFVMLGAVPNAVTVVQVVLAAAHRVRDHYAPDEVDVDRLPRVAVLVPAWNEAAVLRFSVDRMMALDYPPDALRLVVVDDASTDETPELMAAKSAQYPGRVLHLRRARGGEGKAHTLNHGLREILADDWAEAVLITDADVVFEPTSVRRMTRHLADENVGAVTAFIKEASEPPNWMNRYIGYEYAAAQAVGRRAQNVAGAQGCLAGGAQLHTRANLEQLGGTIDTTTLAEDTVTTFLTQLAGRRVVFDGNAHCLAEEPAGVVGLWKQRLRWSRGNVQVARRFRGVFFRPSRTHRLGRPWFGLMWWSTLLLPAFMVASSAALVTLWFADDGRGHDAFRLLWIVNSLGFVLTTVFTLLVDRQVAARTWRQAFAFPGLVSLVVILWVLAPRPMHELVRSVCEHLGLGWDAHVRAGLALAAYGWGAACMLAAYLVYRLDSVRDLGWFGGVLLFLVGYGPLLCAITFAAYVAEARGATATWDKTVKTGKVKVAA